MALTEFYCDPVDGSNLNAGSTTGNPLATYASGSWVAATGVFTVASGNPQSDGVAAGMFASVYPDGTTPATVFVGRVTAVDTTTITVSLTVKMGTAPTDGTSNRTLKVGGAWKGPNGTDTFPAGLFPDTLTNAAGDYNRLNLKNNAVCYPTVQVTWTRTDGKLLHIEGYATTPGDGGIAVIDAGGGAFTPWYTAGWSNQLSSTNYLHVRNNTGNYPLIYWGSQGAFYRCKASEAGQYGFSTTYQSLMECTAENVGKSVFGGGFSASYGSVFNFTTKNPIGSAGIGGYVGYPSVIGRCSSYGGLHGFTCGRGGIIEGCSVYRPSQRGFYMESTAVGAVIQNCIAEKCGYYAYSQIAGAHGRIVNCAHYDCTRLGTGSAALAAVVDIDPITLTRSPFRDPENLDFTPVTSECIGAGYTQYPLSDFVSGEVHLGAIAPRRMYRAAPIRGG
ncbi:MAG: hypothetical protein ACOY3P_20365 [Planctomycetota bacterium]